MKNKQSEKNIAFVHRSSHKNRLFQIRNQQIHQQISIAYHPQLPPMAANNNLLDRYFSTGPGRGVNHLVSSRDMVGYYSKST
jgi:hypothetical protein